MHHFCCSLHVETTICKRELPVSMQALHMILDIALLIQALFSGRCPPVQDNSRTMNWKHGEQQDQLPLSLFEPSYGQQDSIGQRQYQTPVTGVQIHSHINEQESAADFSWLDTDKQLNSILSNYCTLLRFYMKACLKKKRFEKHGRRQFCPCLCCAQKAS